MELHHNHKLALQRNQKSHRKRLQVIDSYEGCSRRGVKNRCLVSNSGAQGGHGTLARLTLLVTEGLDQLGVGATLGAGELDEHAPSIA